MVVSVGRLEIEYVLVKDLKPNSRNARRRGQPQIESIKASVDNTGGAFVEPALIDENNVLIAGHGRLEAAKQMGHDTIPVIRLEHLSDRQKRTLAIALNRIPEHATWDMESLKIELEELLVEEGDLSISDVTGFSAPMIEAIVHGDDFAAPDPGDEVPAVIQEGAPIARLGDIFEFNGHRIGCGDSRDGVCVGALMAGERATQVTADVPFNQRINRHVSGKGRAKHREFVMASGEMSDIEFKAFNSAWLIEVARVVRDGALIYVFIDGAHIAELIEAGRGAGLVLVIVCVWAKTNAGMGSLYRSQTEFVVVFKSGRGKHVNNVELGRHGRNRSNLWTYPGMNAFGRGRDAALKLHPSVKPVGLLADMILDASRRGDIVLDPFLGSGSTIIAAHRTGRRGFGLELDPLYVDAALDRLAAVIGVDPVRVCDGARWSELRRHAEEDKNG